MVSPAASDNAVPPTVRLESGVDVVATAPPSVHGPVSASTCATDGCPGCVNPSSDSARALFASPGVAPTGSPTINRCQLAPLNDCVLMLASTPAPTMRC